MTLRKCILSPIADRIVLTFCFASGILALFVGFSGRSFIDFCVGGILSMPFAIIFGVSISRKVYGEDQSIVTRGILGFLLSFILSWFVIISFLLPMKDGKANAARIRHLQEGSISRIVFYDEFGKEVVGVIDSEDQLIRFVQLAKDIQVNQPRASHVSYEKSWQVEILFTIGTPMRMTWVHLDTYRDSVFGQFLDGDSSLAIYHGTYYSKNMREWFIVNVEPVLLND